MNRALNKKDFDAVVVGSGPNGFAAAITLQMQGLSVLIIEAKETIGGGLRTESITLPGFLHDICSAVHPMAVNSSFFQSLPLSQYGLEYIYPPVDAAHPFDDGSSAILKKSLEETALSLDGDQSSYIELIRPLLKNWPVIKDELLSPFHFPRHPMEVAQFAIKGLQPATMLARAFREQKAKGLWAGVAAHAIQPLTNIATSAIGLVMLLLAHKKGWPVIRGGSAKISDALAAYFISLGGKIETGRPISTLSQLPSATAVLFDVTPRQLIQIAGHSFSLFYKWQLKRYRYGMGVFKIDWALSEPAPFISTDARMAGTVHIGNTFEEIVQGEWQTSRGVQSEKPFVIFTQPSVFDASRAPCGKHTAWAYCHVPHGSAKDMTAAIENQVERFAPGFRERILARHTMNTRELENYNANYIGGDINGGLLDIEQLFTRPALRSSPYRTSSRGLYICSSSTPPGGGVHGMCGYHAAKRALKDMFAIDLREMTP
jgi:phytoene dehydrogenase-like protein